MYVLIGLLLGGFLLGRLIQYLKSNNTFHIRLQPLIMWVIFLLLFFLGVSLGGNEKLIAQLSSLGLQAFLLSTGAILGSLLTAKLIHHYFFKNKDHR